MMPEPTRNFTLGELIRYHRKVLGSGLPNGRSWTQADLAAAIGGISVDTVSNWERGKTSPNETNLQLLIRTFGLLDGDGVPNVKGAAIIRASRQHLQPLKEQFRTSPAIDDVRPVEPLASEPFNNSFMTPSQATLEGFCGLASLILYRQKLFGKSIAVTEALSDLSVLQDFSQEIVSSLPVFFGQEIAIKGDSYNVLDRYMLVDKAALAIARVINNSSPIEILSVMQFGPIISSKIVSHLLRFSRKSRDHCAIVLKLLNACSLGVMGTNLFRNTEDILVRLLTSFTTDERAEVSELTSAAHGSVLLSTPSDPQFLNKGILTWIGITGSIAIRELILPRLNEREREWSTGFLTLSSFGLYAHDRSSYRAIKEEVFDEYHSVSRSPNAKDGFYEAISTIEENVNRYGKLSFEKLSLQLTPNYLSARRFYNPKQEHRWGRIAGFSEFMR